MGLILTNRQRENFDAKTQWEPNSGCALWSGFVNMWGYGKVSLGSRPALSAHRVSFEDTYGPIPVGMVVRHKCDTPACVNPHHLTLGTNAQNVADRVTRGRSAAKLSPSQVRAVRSAPGRYRLIAAEFGVSVAAVCLIKNNLRHAGV